MSVRRTVAVLVLTGGIAAASAAPALGVTIRGSGSRWRPSSVRIDTGDRVRWRAVSGTHTVRAFGGGWRFSERIEPGDPVSRRFNASGTYRFFCSIHGRVAGDECTGMCGRVRV